MNIDNKMPLLKNFMTETKLNQSGLKSTINDSAVASSEQNNVSLELKNSAKNLADGKFKKRKKESQKEDQYKDKSKTKEEIEKTNNDLKAVNLKKVNSFVI
jgi:hypothetical protein